MDAIQGKVAFVTGAGSGIGLGITRAFVAAGIRVVLADLRQDRLSQALAAFQASGHGDSVHGVQVDVSDLAAMEAAAMNALHRFGRIHILVNNAGIGIEGPLSEATAADWGIGMGVNFGGVVNGLQAFLPLLRSHGESSHIVNTASLAAFVAMPPHLAIYAASKAAVVALSEALRVELAPLGIGVSALCPGPVKSNIHETLMNLPEGTSLSPTFRDACGRLAHRAVSSLWMDPDQVGSLVIDAIIRNAPYIITHGEWREAIEGRHKAILAALPPAQNPELLNSMRNK